MFNGKDKAFFFFNYEEYRLPESTLRTRNVFSARRHKADFTNFSRPPLRYLRTGPGVRNHVHGQRFSVGLLCERV